MTTVQTFGVANRPVCVYPLLFALLSVVGCGSDTTEPEPGPFEPVIAPQIANGGTQATATDYWVGNFSTTGAYLLMQIFEDGSGRLSYHNDAFQPPTGLTTRTFYPFEWTEEESGSITLTYTTVTATFSAFADIMDGTSFDVVFSDGTNTNEAFTFLGLPLPGGVGTDPPT